ncbi:MAG: M50 family metallopeptidase [Clostridia bacterium]|nr:M50 family metallopeptidase [Clostridia bacterium]
MDFIRDYFTNQDITGVFSALGVSLKTTFLVLVIILVIGCVASAVEKITTFIISIFLGGAFALVFCNYITFPGVILHELSHALVALLTGAKVTEIHFFKLGTPIGYVTYHERGPRFIRALQSSLTACAPVVFGSVVALLLIDVLTKGSYSVGVTVLLVYLIISVIDHMTMSIPDIIYFFKGIWALAAFILTISLIICLNCIQP